MSQSLEKQVALITGASRGIGKAIALGLAEKKMKLALASRNQSELESVAELCRQKDAEVVVLPFDASNNDSVAELVGQTTKALGQLNVLINNAGVHARGTADQFELEVWDRALSINVRNLVALTRNALPEIEKHPWGAVINIASVAGQNSFAGSGLYCATKHAVLGFTGSLYEDVREKNIKVCAICPGFVNTDMVRQPHLNSEKMIQPEDIARTVNFVLEFPDTGCPVEITVRPQRNPYK